VIDALLHLLAAALRLRGGGQGKPCDRDGSRREHGHRGSYMGVLVLLHGRDPDLETLTTA
jgi:hypothetical protein